MEILSLRKQAITLPGLRSDHNVVVYLGNHHLQINLEAPPLAPSKANLHYLVFWY